MAGRNDLAARQVAARHRRRFGRRQRINPAPENDRTPEAAKEDGK
jgi:hypothetical protein